MEKLMRIALRTASTQDFEYCKRLYFTGMTRIIEELHLDMAAQAVSFREQWVLTQVRIITFDSFDVGWLQTTIQDDVLFVAQLFVDGPFQRKGIGTEVMHRLIGEATRLNQAVCLAVVKINPAFRLYERLGFQITHEDDRKFYMNRDPDRAAST
jgi:GNAT superfamily N-acetyltransferase